MRIITTHIIFLLLISLTRGFPQVPWQVANDSRLTHHVMTVLLDPSTLVLGGELSFEEGDALGAFVDSADVLNCVGYFIWDTTNTLKTLYIHIDMNNQYGFGIGDTVFLRQWDNSSACIRDIYQVSAVSSTSTHHSTITFNPDTALFIESMTASDISFTYDTTLFCWEDTMPYLPIINNSLNHTDDGINYDYTSSSSQSVDSFTGEITPYLSSEVGEFQITLSTDYCIASSTFDYQIQDCVEELPLANDKTLTPYFEPSGISNSLFPIDQNAKVEIFDIKGRLVNELQAPINWDGSDHNGNMLPTGLYFILLDGEKKFELTLVR